MSLGCPPTPLPAAWSIAELRAISATPWDLLDPHRQLLSAASAAAALPKTGFPSRIINFIHRQSARPAIRLPRACTQGAASTKKRPLA